MSPSPSCQDRKERLCNDLLVTVKRYMNGMDNDVNWNGNFGTIDWFRFNFHFLFVFLVEGFDTCPK